MADIIRDSYFGQIVRLLTNNKYFLYEEEKPAYIALDYEQIAQDDKTRDSAGSNATPHSRSEPEATEDSTLDTVTATPNTGTDLADMTNVVSAEDIEKALSRMEGHDEDLVPPELMPKRTADGAILIDWYNAGM